MKLVRLYIDSFMCFDKAYIDFTQFSAALIVGKKDNNDHFSNGVGKTSIFRAIEYVLFNHSDGHLERIVLDDTSLCRVVIDFMIGDQEYRLARSRSKKGNADLTLLRRKAQSGSDEEVYHKLVTNTQGETDYIPHTDKKEVEKYWEVLSGNRAGDTEKDLSKLIKFTQKSFRSTVYFMQFDLAGLSTVTAEKRKGILKDALNLLVYAKLEEIAKKRFTALSKEAERTKILLDNLNFSEDDLTKLAKQLAEVEAVLFDKNGNLALVNSQVDKHNQEIQTLNQAVSKLENTYASLLAQKNTLTADCEKTEVSVKEYTSKRANVIKAAKEIISELDCLKETQGKLVTLDYAQIDILNEEINKKKEQVTGLNLTIKSNLEEYEDLKIPLPSGSMCKTCRKPMTDKDREDCREHDNQRMKLLQASIQEAKKNIAQFNGEITKCQQSMNALRLAKQQLEEVNTKITIKGKEYQDKNELHANYKGLLEKFKRELEEKTKELEAVKTGLENSSMEEANNLRSRIEEEKKKIVSLMTQVSALNKEITHFNNSKAVIQNNIEQKTNDKIKRDELAKSLIDLQRKCDKYPLVIQGFSSLGIPNLIIQDVLDDLQIEANRLLSLLWPRLQLAFFVEKTNGKGDQEDTLDIKYYVNGKERYYEHLSGAMRVAVAFGLKLGLSILLQNRLGVEFKFLLIDEIDQPLDKASVDAFADMVKLLQNDYTILAITHNDRLKDKFSHAVLVEQNMDDVSRARVVSAW